ncbi:MFS general substrate transporter [Aspergillus costaricaensis CBS 115574]|uniref:MFS general substrate transporter n=1 Tax=Aspergillus costaricaensis CBS 115574 TaxID=1448317 RepID=A0ACD1IC20_9EURO|nr:MFS general substrate transporter [Aspergillus costaricaensis CBS 115574]RAK88020.1 MFS general substrate transporter [Aspergillus costaricaensis CBS 115574]
MQAEDSAISKTTHVFSETRHRLGDVKLVSDNHIVLVPTPSSDPHDPLKLPAWRKWMILVLISAYSFSAVVLVSGLGPILSVIQAEYPGQERVNDLMTYPTLFMGIGNIISMPLALALGRRPVFVFSILLLVVTSIWCAFSKSLDSHIAGRDIMGIAAGQSEALAPMIIHEICFLHERGRKVAWFVFIQNISCGAFYIASTYMVDAWGWRWWYGVFAILNGAILLLSIVFVTETAFERTPEAMRGESHDSTTLGKDDAQTTHQEVVSVDSLQTQQPRSFLGHMTLVQVTPQWRRIPDFYRHLVQAFCVPSIFWLFLLNGAFLGVYIFQSSTFSTILLAPPYAFPFTSLGYVQAAQIIVCFIFLPLLGYGSDYAIRVMSRRNRGQYKPEYRFLSLVMPSITGVVSAVLYGQAGSFPSRWHWSAIAVPFQGVFFGFLGVNIVGITYALDSFPMRSAALLVVICAGRGLVGFGLSYAVLPSIKAIGYHGSMNVQAIICAVIAAMAVPMYFAGPWTRGFAQRKLGMDQA